MEILLWVNAGWSLFMGAIWSRNSIPNVLFKLGFFAVGIANLYFIFKVL